MFTEYESQKWAVKVLNATGDGNRPFWDAGNWEPLEAAGGLLQDTARLLGPLRKRSQWIGTFPDGGLIYHESREASKVRQYASLSLRRSVRAYSHRKDNTQHT